MQNYVIPANIQLTYRETNMKAFIRNFEGKIKVDFTSFNDKEFTETFDTLEDALNAINQKKCVELNLSFNNIGDVGAEAIAQSLKANTTLQELILSNNQIGDVGAKAIAQALTFNNTLQELILSNNQIGDVGAKAIAQALKANTTLQILILSNNQIGDVGTKAIEQVLKSNHNLVIIDGEYTPNYELAKKYADKIMDPSTISDLNIHFYAGMIKRRSAIAFVLKKNGKKPEEIKKYFNDLRLVFLNNAHKILGICKEYNTENPFAILPKEIYKLIFSCLSPKDIENLAEKSKITPKSSDKGKGFSL